MNSFEQEIAISSFQSTGNFKVLRRLHLDEDPRFTRRGRGWILYGTCVYNGQEIWKK